MKQYIIAFCIIMFLVFIGCGDASAWAEPSQEPGGYLAAYQEPVAKPAQNSWWSMFSYLLSLVVVFIFIALSAYIVSRMIGRKFGLRYAGNGTARVLENLPLGGGNRSVVVVDIAGKVLLLGVSENGITLLDEVEDVLEIARLREQSELMTPQGDFQEIFDKQLMSLEKLSKRVPVLFKERKDRR